jgi:glycosyltransferase involved in cell wall biosynthesis
MKAKKNAVVCVSNDLATDNRVAKTCDVLEELDYQVVLIGRKRNNSPEMPARNYITRRMNLWFDKGPLFYLNLNLRIFFFLMSKRTSLIFSNDLDTLPACFLAYLFKPKTRIIYDTHELFTEVSELKERPVRRGIWLRMEKWIFPKLKTVITVNDSIAAIYNQKYKVPIHVVRNIPLPYKGHENRFNSSSFGLRDDDFILIIQGSGLNKDRGIEESILSMKHCENCVLLIVGDGDVIPDAKILVQKHKLSNQVKFISRRPYNELMKITQMANLGLLMDKAVNQNHELALPNKLFDYLHAGTPILSNRLKEIEKIIVKYDIGVIIDDVTPEGIARSVMAFKGNQKLQQQLKTNCITAAKKENWLLEKSKLIAAIKE